MIRPRGVYRWDGGPAARRPIFPIAFYYIVDDGCLGHGFSFLVFPFAFANSNNQRRDDGDRIFVNSNDYSFDRRNI